MIDLDVTPRGIATLTLQRADKHNALSQALIDALLHAAQDIAARDDIRVVILAGDGPTFCAGGDLGWMRDQMAGNDAMKRNAARSIATMLGALNNLPQPLIGRLHGNAFGGGVGLACVCDIVIAADTARLGLTETKLGLVPATIGPYVMARMGEANARKVLLSSRIFNTLEARDLGIVSQVVDPSEIDAAIAKESEAFLLCAPGAVAATKAYVRSLGLTIDESMIERSIDALITQWNGNEAKEGISAFFGKRAPVWAG